MCNTLTVVLSDLNPEYDRDSSKCASSLASWASSPFLFFTVTSRAMSFWSLKEITGTPFSLCDQSNVSHYHTIITAKRFVLQNTLIYGYTQRQWRKHILVGLSVAEPVLQVYVTLTDVIGATALLQEVHLDQKQNTLLVFYIHILQNSSTYILWNPIYSNCTHLSNGLIGHSGVQYWH